MSSIVGTSEMNVPMISSIRTRVIASMVLSCFGISLTCANPAKACSCYFPDDFTYADRFDYAQEVIVGQVLFSFGFTERVYTAIRTEVDAKGCVASKHRTIWIETAATEAECGVELERGERYMLHLNGKNEDGTYPLGLCSFHKKLEDLSSEELNHLLAQSPECNNEVPEGQF